MTTLRRRIKTSRGPCNRRTHFISRRKMPCAAWNGAWAATMTTTVPGWQQAARLWPGRTGYQGSHRAEYRDTFCAAGRERICCSRGAGQSCPLDGAHEDRRRHRTAGRAVTESVADSWRDATATATSATARTATGTFDYSTSSNGVRSQRRSSAAHQARPNECMYASRQR